MRPDARPGSPGLIAQEYYLALLAGHRAAFGLLAGGFALTHGHQPSFEDQQSIRKMLDSGLGRERLVLENKRASPHLTDEHLVYHAVTHALETGQPTMILSADFDVAAQFRHLINLLHSHYRAMLLAELYEQDFARFRPRSIPSDALSGYFLEEHTVAIDLTDFKDEDPWPAEPSRNVAITCTTATPHHVSEMFFNAETEMFQVVRLKGRTCGLSTDRLGGRNLHSWHVLPEVPRGHGIVASDIQAPVSRRSNARIAMADLLLSHAAIR